MNFTQELLGNPNTFLYNNILIILLVAMGLHFSLRTDFVQSRMLGEGLHLFGEKAHHHDDVSFFQVLTVSMVSHVGTDNIAGVVTALAVGEAGSIFWMWVIALVGGVSTPVESMLVWIYKEHDGDQLHGGPVYYIEKALHKRRPGILFTILLITCFIFGLSGLQVYSVSSALGCYVTDTQAALMLAGLVLAGATTAVIFGGVHRIGITSSAITPIMTVLYILLGLYITMANIGGLLAIFTQTFREAFDLQAIFEGFVGSCATYGVKRGLLSNEAGMGSVPDAGATVDISHPAKQGSVQTIPVFIDTILIYSTTALMLLSFGIRGGLTGMPYAQTAAFAEVGTWGIHFITIPIILFVFSSLIGNCCYAESNSKFITNDKKVLLVPRPLTTAVISFRTQADLSTAQDLADVLTGSMVTEDILVILLPGNAAFPILKSYTKQKKQGKDPLFEP